MLSERVAWAQRLCAWLSKQIGAATVCPPAICPSRHEPPIHSAPLEHSHVSLRGWVAASPFRQRLRRIVARCDDSSGSGAAAASSITAVSRAFVCARAAAAVAGATCVINVFRMLLLLFFFLFIVRAAPIGRQEGVHCLLPQSARPSSLRSHHLSSLSSLDMSKLHVVQRL